MINISPDSPPADTVDLLADLEGALHQAEGLADAIDYIGADNRIANGRASAMYAIIGAVIARISDALDITHELQQRAFDEKRAVERSEA